MQETTNTTEKAPKKKLEKIKIVHQGKKSQNKSVIDELNKICKCFIEK